MFLVKDEGIYLMSTAKGQEQNPDTGKLPVVYALGYNPETDGDVWDATYEVSHDDFAEYVGITQAMLDDPRALAVVIGLSKTKLTVRLKLRTATRTR